MKLRSLHIEDYKIFKDFDIDFLDSNNNPLDVVVLAGVNGSGKTTLFEFIINYFQYEKNKLIAESQGKTFGLGGGYSFGSLIKTDFIDTIKNDSVSKIMTKMINKNNIIYLSAGQDNILDVKESIFEHYRRLSREYSHKEALKDIQDFLNTIFNDDMGITFTIEDIDIVVRENEKVIFKNSSGATFDIESLSTGEKTLLSKVLYLYFKDYKNEVILIDEPELSLHPSWQNKVLKIYKNFAKLNNCQVIIATHSPHIIASADNKYIRFLEKNEEGNIIVVNDIEAYGRDINWVLEQMGVKNLRVSDVLEQFTKCQQFLNERKYDEAEECIDALEEKIGKNDKQIMSLRNALFFERD